MADYNRCLDFNPKYAMAHYNKGELFNKIDKKKEALESYQSFLKCAPAPAGEYVQRAQERIKALGK